MGHAFTYRQPLLLQETHLAVAIIKWSEPGGLVLWTAPFATKLHRKHRIGFTLMDVLRSWMPKECSNTPLPPDLQPHLPPRGMSDETVSSAGSHLSRYASNGLAFRLRLILNSKIDES